MSSSNLKQNEQAININSSNINNKEQNKNTDISSLVQNSNQKLNVVENSQIEANKIPETDYKDNNRDRKDIKSNEVKFISGNYTGNTNNERENSRNKYKDVKVASCRNKDNSINNFTPVNSNRWRTNRGKLIYKIILI